MKSLHLLRHAKAGKADAGTADFERELAERGRAACGLLAAWYAEQEMLPDIVPCSPAQRTRETLALIAASLGEARIRYEERIYEAEADTLLTLVRALPREARCALLVGHNPGIEMLARRLAGSGATGAIARMRTKYPTGAIAVLSAPVRGWTALRPGGARLDAFIRPADLEGLGPRRPSAPAPRGRAPR